MGFSLSFFRQLETHLFHDRGTYAQVNVASHALGSADLCEVYIGYDLDDDNRLSREPETDEVSPFVT